MFTQFLVYLNICFLAVILCWSLYKVHISDKLINRLSYVAVGFGATIIIISHLVPSYSTFFYQTYVWQRLVFNSCLAFRCLTEFYCEYGSEKFKEAFVNSKNKFIHLTRN